MSAIAKPKVLIVGAGLGGMALGILLHKAKIPFEIYERASVVKPLGIYYSCAIGLMLIYIHIGSHVLIQYPFHSIHIHLSTIVTPSHL